jgi:NH3-dependent NAD+ synthetase
LNKDFQSRVDRLAEKIVLSQTPVPGFIVGLSGTDSIVAFMIAYAAMARFGKHDRILGVHYTNLNKKVPGSFEKHAIPWLRERCPGAQILVEEPLGVNYDQQRWADIHLRALHSVKKYEGGQLKIERYPHGETYWIVGTINATERALGKYSLISDSASIQLVQTLYKTNIMRICEDLGVPEMILENARLPDCACGREEIAANNIELLDDIIRYRVDITKHDPELIAKLYEYIQEQKKVYGFKVRIPYVI